MYLTPETPIYINRVSESFELAEHKHEFMEINYVGEGSGFHHIEGQTIPVAKGDMFFLPVGVSHVFRPAGAQPGRSHLIVYNCLFGSEFARMLSGFGGEYLDLVRCLDLHSWLHWKDRDGTFQRILSSMHEEFVRKRPDCRLLLQTEMTRLLIHMRRSLAGAAALENHAGADETLDQIIRLIRERAAEPLSISNLASLAGLSERQFRRRFIMRTGMNFTEFIHQLRIEACCKLLVSTNEKVSTIAYKAGYQDIKFFNRLFKKKTGMTPMQYRSMNINMDRRG